MRIHQEWATSGFELPPLAPSTSIFPTRAYLQLWWRHFGNGELNLVESETALLPVRRSVDGTVSFVGDEDLTDYHSPLGMDAGPLLRAFLSDLPAGTGFRLDSLPIEAARELAAGLAAEPVRHEAAFRIDLPGDFETFLARLRKKERQELRRKHRRFVEASGPPRLLDGSADPIGVFVGLHRMAQGTKGRFMTPEREAFFRDLAALPGAHVDILSGDDDAPVAAALGFGDDDAYYLYNSAYDPAAAALSPGMVLLWMLFERAISTGIPRFDFLKGDEDYKLRLGAEPRPLYVLEGTT